MGDYSRNCLVGDLDMKRFAIYLIRWQASTPILYLVIYLLGAGVWQTIAANIAGGITFYWIDKWIFEPQPKRMDGRVASYSRLFLNATAKDDRTIV